jgi:extradiol dioxygenase family protein
MRQPPTFAPGRNLALKVPPHQYEATVHFYGTVLGLKRIEIESGEVGFDFGGKQLWIDRVPTLSQAELWLEVVTDDLAAADAHLAAAGVVRCDEIEPLGEDFQGFWITSPASIIHLVCKDDSSW